MADSNTFRDFVRRIRAGDEQAALTLVREYEPFIRREVRLHLQDQRLCRLFDSMDICQSVLASFFVRTAAGQYDLDRPDQLLKLLISMARKKLAMTARRHRRQRRDHRRNLADVSNKLELVEDVSPSPSQLAAGKELLQRFRESLTDEERQLSDLRNQGLAWAQIAIELGGTAQARRVQLSRAVDRVAQTLGLMDESYE
jgi:RNA polymerase sigma-70 factor (ECF subfamily)